VSATRSPVVLVEDRVGSSKRFDLFVRCQAGDAMSGGDSAIEKNLRHHASAAE